MEDKLTEKAQGSLERLFSTVPTQATLVQLDASTGAPLTSSSAVVTASSVTPGQHVMVKPGEQVLGITSNPRKKHYLRLIKVSALRLRTYSSISKIIQIQT